MLAYLLEQCSRSGISEVVLAVGYQAAQVRALITDQYAGVHVRYSIEDAPLGTGGALALATARLTHSSVIVLNGDSFIDVDLSAVLAWHRARRAAATIVLTRVTEGSRFGSVSVTHDGQIVEFREKNPLNTGPALINAGIYVFERKTLSRLPTGTCSLERDIIPALVGNGLHGWEVPGSFIDIGLPESYAAASDVLTARPRTSRQNCYVVLDRDGTVIEERHYLHRPDEVVLLENALEGMVALRAQGVQLVLATNQSGVGRGLYSHSDVAAVHARLAALLAQCDVSLSAVYYCPHHPDSKCICRKPGPGMVEQARALFAGALPVAVVGDKACDIGLARAVGTVGILVTTGYGAREFASGLDPDFLVEDLVGAAHVVRELVRQSTSLYWV